MSQAWQENWFITSHHEAFCLSGAFCQDFIRKRVVELWKSCFVRYSNKFCQFNCQSSAKDVCYASFWANLIWLEGHDHEFFTSYDHSMTCSFFRSKGRVWTKSGQCLAQLYWQARYSLWIFNTESNRFKEHVHGLSIFWTMQGLYLDHIGTLSGLSTLKLDRTQNVQN